MKNPLTVATLIYAIAAAATAQTLTPAPSETRGLSNFEVAQIEVRVPGGGVVVVSPGDGALAFLMRQLIWFVEAGLTQ